MRLSVFDSDNTLGDAGGSISAITPVGGSIGVPLGGGVGGSIGVRLSPTGSRLVTIRVRKTMSVGEALIWPISLYENSGLNSTIRAALVNAGWSISNVTQTANFGSGYAEWVIAAEVLNQYSDATVLSNIRTDLGGVIGGNLSAAIVSSVAAYVDAATGRMVNSSGQPLNTGGSGLDQFFANLGSGLGSGLGVSSVTTPILLVAGGLVLLMILKR